MSRFTVGHWPQNEKAQTRGTSGNLSDECRHDRPQPGPVA